MAHNVAAPPASDLALEREHTSTNRAPPAGDAPTKRRPSSAHKRSVSANILSKLPFLRNSWDDLPAHADVRKEEARPGSGSMAQAVRQSSSSGRRRRGSLRKTAILGTRQRSSEHQRTQSLLMDSIVTSPTSPEDSHAPRPFTYAHPDATSSSESGWSSPPAPRTNASSSHMSPTRDLDHHRDTPRAAAVLASPISSPVTSPGGGAGGGANPSYASTTDDDNDSLTSFRRPATSNHLSPNYFPLQSSATSTLQRRRSAKTSSATRHSSPLSLPPATLDVDEWDYSETEWWGWVVLIVTWIVFVVGMGSCFEVWSWAWDVGETPYAPPELEDDPTLPIVGYYPALMVLTAVMAWVWVVIAWVGMKYFRHAKVVGEDG